MEQFRDVVLAGEVDRVNCRAADSGELVSLRWSESPLVWRQAEGGMADLEGPYTTARLMADMSRVLVPSFLVREQVESSRRGVFPGWPFDIPGGWWIAASWALVFFAMLCSTPRLASRWAWFWLFTVGHRTSPAREWARAADLCTGDLGAPAHRVHRGERQILRQQPEAGHCPERG
ncbi:hypothetical protein [Nonomuraea sp. NPDC049684]|uniref:hypothetical protein n=1 Tax=Nonomuraea sp. NPDC049684 TaxID=3364356 RepID=UPI00379469BD